MTVQTEAQLESALVTRLSGMGWARTEIRDEAALWANLRAELGAFNELTLSDAEFRQVRHHLEKGNPFEKAHTLRDRFRVSRDDGSDVWIRFLNSEHWCRNRYQVATQIGIQGRRENRYDVTLLINGLPLGQIELKRPGVELKEAFNQINRYQRDGFGAAGGLFQYVQIFIISNGVNTRYYANNRHQSFKQTFTWANPDNAPINQLEAFTDAFLDKCHFSKMVAKYVVMHESDKLLMVLRPYQYYAAERILERVQLAQGNGYVWHTTGSGKTLTSFKAAQNVVALPKVDKVVFVVDRADLDYQTTKEFNHFRPGSVDGTSNTRQLVNQLADPNTKLVITTIQKLNTAISRDQYLTRLEPLKRGRVVFIFDECHRSQFGDTHRRIRAFFERAQLFGFTGTPIFDVNAIATEGGLRTTEDLFGDRLHRYIITDAIRDENVLRFSIEYLRVQGPDAETADGSAAKPAKKGTDQVPQELYDHPDRINKIVDWVIENHDRKTHGRRFGAIFAVSSVDALCAYYDAFAVKRRAGAHDLRVATIFTYAANEADPAADGLIPDTEFPADGAGANDPKRDRLMGYVADYNALYGVNESVRDGKGFYAYYRSIAQRMKGRDRKDFVPEQGIDILLVVNMFLTGFDAKTLSTLYADKSLKYHGLIQAFSRTNRVLNQEKSHGNIVCFRQLNPEVDAALALFADPDAAGTVFTGDYQEHLDQFHQAMGQVLAITPDADAVDQLPDETAQAGFLKAFRDVLRLQSVLEGFSEYDPADREVDPQGFEGFRSKYLDLHQRSRRGTGDGGDGPATFENFDFEIELLKRDEINLTYILSLLARMGGGKEGEKRDDEAYRRRVMELIQSDPRYLDKGELIRKFMTEVIPSMSPGEEVLARFKTFWTAERAAAFQRFSDENGLIPERVESLVQNLIFSGRRPPNTEIVEVMREQPRLLDRQKACDRIFTGVRELLSRFDDHMTDLDHLELDGAPE